MNTRLSTKLAIAAAGGLLLALIGCGHDGRGTEGSGAIAEQASAKSGAQLWSENCSRCHWARPPQSYSDAQWQTVVHHMRLRADLTGQEQRAITTFLQASH
jgi:cytochrome c1